MTEIVTMPRPVVGKHFRVLLPVAFVVLSVLGAMVPGHAGKLFAIGALPGVWAGFLVTGGEQAGSWLLPTLLAGAPLLWFLGRLLDRLRADLTLWSVAAVVVTMGAGYTLLQGYADLEAAVLKQGSFFAFVVCALQLGCYGATVVALALSGRSS
ncbi:MAG: hypothetical protein JNN13_13635 [Planctomycetes bacterium]|nr:hypothetical protein [Planctomycetota bacterium]